MKDNIRIGLGIFMVLPLFIVGILVVVVLVCLKHIIMPTSGRRAEPKQRILRKIKTSPAS